MAEFDVDPALMRRLENVGEMINRMGLDPFVTVTSSAAAVLGSAVRICEACPAGEVCHDWLLRAAKTLYQALPFCPNAGRFAQLLAEQRQVDDVANDADAAHCY